MLSGSTLDTGVVCGDQYHAARGACDQRAIRRAGRCRYDPGRSTGVLVPGPNNAKSNQEIVW